MSEHRHVYGWSERNGVEAFTHEHERGSEPHEHVLRDGSTEVKQTAWEDAPAAPAQRSELVAGFRGPEACAASGVTYRQLDYWCRTGLVEPSVRAAHGSGTQRLYSREDVAALCVARALLEAGMSLSMIRQALPELLKQRGEVTVNTDSPYARLVVDVDAIVRNVPDPPSHAAIAPPPSLTVVP